MSKYVTFEDLVRFHKEVIAPDLDARLDARMGQLATKSDLRSEIDGLRSEMRSEIGSVRSEIDGIRSEIGGLRGEMRSEIGSVRSEIGGVRTLVAGVAVSLQSSMEAGFRAVVEDAAENKRDILGHFDHVYARLNEMAMEYTALKGGLGRVEERLSKLDGSTN